MQTKFKCFKTFYKLQLFKLRIEFTSTASFDLTQLPKCNQLQPRNALPNRRIKQ